MERTEVSLLRAYQATLRLVLDLAREFHSTELEVATFNMTLDSNGESSDPACFPEFREIWGPIDCLDIDTATALAMSYLASPEFTTRPDIPTAFTAAVNEANERPENSILRARWQELIKREVA